MSHLGSARIVSTAGTAVALFWLAGCHGQVSTLGGEAHLGRYFGVGIYEPSGAWSKLEASAPSDPTAARLTDDQAIIVVVDSQTGEIRACGDLSGYCVGMDPWRAGLAKPQLAPVPLTAHIAVPTDAAASAGNSAAVNAPAAR